MNSFLLTWNPNNFKWDDLKDCIDEVQENGNLFFNWSVCSNKPAAGDWFYLMLVGCSSYNGIIGAGHILSDPYEFGDVMPRRRKYGSRRKFVDINFRMLFDPDKELLVENTVLRHFYPEQLWTPQSSGIIIKDHCAEFLRSQYFKKLISLRRDYV